MLMTKVLLQTELSATSMEVAAACVAGTAGLAAVYRVARPYFSVRVNCHFCNNNYKVSGVWCRDLLTN